LKVTELKIASSKGISFGTKTVKANLKESNDYYSLYKRVQSDETQPF
jgi:hypothetical protein